MSEEESSVAWTADESAYAQYLIRSPQEIAQILRALMKAPELVTAYFDHGNRFFITSVLAVQPGGNALFLDLGVDADNNRRAQEASRAVFVTNLDRVKVQFSTGPLREVEFNGRPAFRAPLPSTLLRLQRREYYRLATLIRAPMTCEIPDLPGDSAPSVTDISVGGVGLSGLPQDSMHNIGDRLNGCRIVLPEEGTLLTTLEIRSLQNLTLRSGATVKRAGCRFVEPSRNQEAMIQRYITRAERERLGFVKGR